MPGHDYLVDTEGKKGSRTLEDLCQQYRITDANLTLRREFLRLEPRDARLLASLQGWAERNSSDIAREFYDHQFAFSGTRRFFEATAKQKAVSLVQLRAVLEKTQAEYFRQIFDEAAESGTFGPAYYEQRLRVGRVHNLIDLPLKWYVGSYTVYFDIVSMHLGRHFILRPRQRRQAERAILTVFNFDMQAVVEAFYFDTFRSIGVDLAAISVGDPDFDLSDCGADLKGTVTTMLAGVADDSVQLNAMGRSLATTAHESRQATLQIATTVQQMAQGAQEQTGAVLRVSTAVDRLQSEMEQVASRAATIDAHLSAAGSSVARMSAAIAKTVAASESVTVVAESAARATDEGGATIRESVAGMQRIRSSVQRAAGVVGELGEKGRQIGAIVETIDEIASQTNLLALNAAIEAARVGEAGRGFAVVADEVRRLAERSAMAAADIATLIAEVQNSTDEAVAAMRHGEAEVDRGYALADQASTALNEIGSAVKETSTAIGKIGEANETLTAASTEVVDALHDAAGQASEAAAAVQIMTGHLHEVGAMSETIAAVSEEHAASAQEVAATTVELTKQTETLAEAAQALPALAAQLEAIVVSANLNLAPKSAGSHPAHGEGARDQVHGESDYAGARGHTERGVKQAV